MAPEDREILLPADQAARAASKSRSLLHRETITPQGQFDQTPPESLPPAQQASGRWTRSGIGSPTASSVTSCC